jgi:hypothetical protein
VETKKSAERQEAQAALQKIHALDLPAELES